MKQLLRVFALGLVFALLAAACGSDDSETDNGGSQEAAVDNAAWCDAYVAAQYAVIGVSSGRTDPSEIPPLLDALEQEPPAEVADTIAEFVPQIRDALETEDDSLFGSDEFTATDEELDVYVGSNCGYETIEVDAVDYAFEGLRETVSADTVTIDWTNAGEEVHEFLLVRLLDETLTTDDLLKLSDKEAESKLEFVNASFGPPGTEDVESVPLQAGTYLAVCFLPVGATDMEALEKADGPPHITQGMVSEFTVE